jgi:hypothetical protein
MLWYKVWIETRWRFWIGLVVLACSMVATVLTYPRVLELLQRMPELDLGGALGRRAQEGIALAREYRGYVWSHAFAQEMSHLGTLFAVLLGAGGLISPRGGALFTLSLPISRSRLLAVRAGTGLAQWLALALVPMVLLPVFSPAVHESYGIGAALVHGLCLFTAGAAFFSLTVLLSTVFADVWRPLLFALVIAVALSIPEQFAPEVSRHSIFGVMSGEMYFRTGRMPWLGLLASAAGAAALLYAAARNFARRDF